MCGTVMCTKCGKKLEKLEPCSCDSGQNFNSLKQLKDEIFVLTGKAYDIAHGMSDSKELLTVLLEVEQKLSSI